MAKNNTSQLFLDETQPSKMAGGSRDDIKCGGLCADPAIKCGSRRLFRFLLISRPKTIPKPQLRFQGVKNRHRIQNITTAQHYFKPAYVQSLSTNSSPALLPFPTKLYGYCFTVIKFTRLQHCPFYVTFTSHHLICKGKLASALSDNRLSLACVWSCLQVSQIHKSRG